MDRFNLEEIIIQALEDKKLDNVYELLDTYKIENGINEFYYLALSDYYIFNNDFNNVIITLKQAINSGYESNEVYERLADAYYCLEQYDEALNYIQMYDFNFDDLNYVRLYEIGAICAYHLSNYKLALQYYEDILMDIPDHKNAYFYAGLCYLKIGDFDRGTEYLKNSIKDDDINSIYRILNFLCEFNNYELLEYFIGFLDEENEYQKYYSFGFYALNQGDFDSAIKNFKTFLRYENNYEVSIELAKIYIHRNDIQRGQDILHDIYDELPDLDDLEFYEQNFLFVLELLSYIDLMNEKKEEVITKWLHTFSYNLLLIEDLFEFSIENELFDVSRKILTLHEHDLEISLHFQYLRVVYYIAIHNYKKALGYLLIMDNQEGIKLYNKYLVVILFFMNQFEKVIEIDRNWLPDGRIAMMLISCYNELGLYDKAFEVSDFMNDFINVDYDDKDMYIRFVESMEMDDD